MLTIVNGKFQNEKGVQLHPVIGDPEQIECLNWFKNNKNKCFPVMVSYTQDYPEVYEFQFAWKCPRCKSQQARYRILPRADWEVKGRLHYEKIWICRKCGTEVIPFENENELIKIKLK